MNRAPHFTLFAILLLAAEAYPQDRVIGDSETSKWQPIGLMNQGKWQTGPAAHEFKPALQPAAKIDWQPDFSTGSSWLIRCTTAPPTTTASPSGEPECLDVFPRQTIPWNEPPAAAEWPVPAAPPARILPPTAPRQLPSAIRRSQPQTPLPGRVEPSAAIAPNPPSAFVGDPQPDKAKAPAGPVAELPPPAIIDKPQDGRAHSNYEAPIVSVFKQNARELWSTVHPFLSRFEGSDEVLLWWLRRDNVPVLASAGPSDGTGVLTDASTVVLYNSGSLDSQARAGYRWRGLFWLDANRTWVLGGSYFFLGRQSNSAEYSSDAYPTLARPVFVLNTNQEGAETVASPNLSTGRLSIANSTSFWGADATLLKRCCFGNDSRIDFIFGYRYLSLVEKIDITESITAGTQAPDPAGTQITVQDRFHTNNTFHGGVIGALRTAPGRFSADVRASVALGSTNQVVDIGGNQLVTQPGMATEHFTGGLLATPTNIGHFWRNRFTIVPEANINLGYQITPRLRVFGGYSMIYWSSVVRPGEQIDRVVDVTQVPNWRSGLASTGQARPGVLFASSGFWVQGVSFGLEYRW